MMKISIVCALFLVTFFSCKSKNYEEEADEYINNSEVVKESRRERLKLKNESDSLLNLLNANKYTGIKLDSIKVKLKSLKANKDEFRNVTFYHSKSEPYGFSNQLYAYIVNDKDFYRTRLVIEYTGEDWLFVKSIDFLCDGLTFHYIPERFKHDNSGGSVYECTDELIEGDLKNITNKIINSKEAKMRYNGTDYYKDRVITAAEKNNLRQVIQILN